MLRSPKLPLLLIVLAVVLLGTISDAASLRQERTLVEGRNEEQKIQNSLEIEFTEREFRALQTTGEDSNDDAGLINRIIQFLLPFINESIARFVPDPLELPVNGEFSLGEIDLLACTASLGFNYNLGSITGLSKLVIDRLSLVLG